MPDATRVAGILMDPAARKISVKVAQATKSRVTFTTR